MSTTCTLPATYDTGIQLIGWGIACSLKTEKIYDLFGSLAFVSCSLLAYLNVGTALARQTLCTGMVVAWALRLGTFLFIRVIKDGGGESGGCSQASGGSFASSSRP